LNIVNPDTISKRGKTQRDDASKGAIDIMRRALQLFTLLIHRVPTLRSNILSLPHFQESLVDMLVACHAETARVTFAKVFLSMAEAGSADGSDSEDALATATLCVKLLLETQPSVHDYPLQCLQYFKLCARLVPKVYKSGTGEVHISVVSLVAAEVKWILELHPPANNAGEDTIMQKPIAGHMIYLCALLACCDVETKARLGKQMIPPLVDIHLFPASRQRLETAAKAGFVPICDSQETRMATLAMVVELCSGCPANGTVFADLLTASHNSEQETRGEWDFTPMDTPRSGCGYVGLANAGATCYMNSVIQQIYANPRTRSYILSLDDDNEQQYKTQVQATIAQSAIICPDASEEGKSSITQTAKTDQTLKAPTAEGKVESAAAVADGNPHDETIDNSLFYEMQRIFGSLAGSRKQYFKPEGLWNTYRDVSNQKVDVRKHEDAVEYFQNLTDKLDAHLAKAGQPKGLELTYQGILADQKICRDPCDCYNETTQPFLNIEADVRNNDNLQESLDQMCQGDELSGENAYHCAKHDMKVTALKRTCIKRLPNTMVVQLKRFEHDWENDRPVKINDRFEFPLMIDMEPWTVAGLARRDAEIAEQAGTSDTAGVAVKRETSEEDEAETTKGTLFRLAGVVVHSGTATAGHYYSFVRTRNPSGAPEGAMWHKFDDKQVTPWAQTDEDMEAEFFGGEYTPKYGNIYAKQERSWSAYILFYERINPTEGAVAGDAVEQPGRVAAAAPAPGTNLLPKLDVLLAREQSAAPATIEQEVSQGNVDFMHRRDMFNPAYFSFVHNFLLSQLTCADDATILATARFATNFVFNTYLHSKEVLRSSCEICPTLELFFAKHPAACGWFLVEVCKTQWLRSLLLECKQSAIRKSAMGIVLKALTNAIPSPQYPSIEIVAIEEAAASHLFRLLDTGAAEYCEHASELFTLYSRYIDLGDRQRAHCLNDGLFERGISFLVGPELFVVPNAAPTTAGADTSDASLPPLPPKRKFWSFPQQRPFRWLRAALFKLIRGSDLTACCDPALQAPASNPYSLPSSIPLRADIRQTVFTQPHSLILLQTIILPALSGSTPVSLEETVSLCCCCAWGNTMFTQLLVTSILKVLASTEVDSNPIFTLMNRLLALDDGLQPLRIIAFVCDPELDDCGVLPLILKLKSFANPKKAYLYTKQLVLMSETVPDLRKLLQGHALKTTEPDNPNWTLNNAQQAININGLWQTVVTWLENELATSYKGYRSNAETDAYSDDNGPLKRTASTDVTLEAAGNIILLEPGTN
jgi:ubiquitin carboxyl-terminal hydrolase 9/24